jgi:hypothetical protein
MSVNDPSGHTGHRVKCPLSGVKRTSAGRPPPIGLFVTCRAQATESTAQRDNALSSTTINLTKDRSAISRVDQFVEVRTTRPTPY